MYKIIGADRREYGPITGEQLRQWISEARVNGQTQVQAEGATEWRPLSAFPEFGEALASPPGGGGPPPIQPTSPGVPQDLLGRDYDLDIGRCIGNAWDLLKDNFGTVFGGIAVFLLVQGGIMLLAQIPLLGILISLASLIVTGPLTGGAYYLLLKVIRRQPAEIGDVFAGFRLGFAQLMLGYLATAILTGLSALPGLMLMAYPIYRMVQEHAAEPLLILWASLGFVVLLVPVIYLSVSWIFTLPLIIDKRTEFWPAMEASRKMVGKHWWLVFGLVVVCGLINSLGFALCCVGLFFSMPITFGALMYAYEAIFSAPATPAR